MGRNINLIPLTDTTDAIDTMEYTYQPCLTPGLTDEAVAESEREEVVAERGAQLLRHPPAARPMIITRVHSVRRVYHIPAPPGEGARVCNI